MLCCPSIEAKAIKGTGHSEVCHHQIEGLVDQERLSRVSARHRGDVAEVFERALTELQDEELIVDNQDSTVDSFRLINPRWLDMLSERWWQKVLSSITLLIGTHGWLS